MLMVTPDAMRALATTLKEIAPNIDTAYGAGQVSTYGLCWEALREGADEIERLRTALGQARRHARAILDTPPPRQPIERKG